MIQSSPELEKTHVKNSFTQKLLFLYCRSLVDSPRLRGKIPVKMISVADSQPSGSASRHSSAGRNPLFTQRHSFEGEQFRIPPATTAHGGRGRQRPRQVASTPSSKPAPASAKALPYLAPAILYAVGHQKKAVISTHTINLQEQLTEKDLPMLAQVLPVKFSYTMLKGRGNYLCSRRLAKAMQQSDSLFHLAPKPRNSSAFTNGPRPPRTAASRTSRSSPTRRSGRMSAPSAAFAPRKSAAISPSSRQTKRRLLLSARPRSAFSPPMSWS